MLKTVLPLAALLLGVWTAALAQYKADAAGAVPTEVAPEIRATLEPGGFKISREGGEPYCEIWFRTEAPAGKGAEGRRNVTLGTIREGALVGVIRFDGGGSDRRGQSIAPGVYTLRYGIMPMNGAHEGAAPQRDFLLLAPAAADRDPNQTPAFDALVSLSKQASLTRHPAVLSVRKAATDAREFSQHGDDWVLQTSVGNTPIQVILIGTAGS